MFWSTLGNFDLVDLVETGCSTLIAEFVLFTTGKSSFDSLVVSN